MQSPTTFRHCTTALFVIALLWTRIAGAHLHFCYDGAEPAAAVHVLDVGMHPEVPCEETGKAINTDVDQGESLGLKVVKASFKLAALPAQNVTAPSQSSFARAPHVPVEPSAWIPRLCLRPPLRGPPSLSTPST